MFQARAPSSPAAGPGGSGKARSIPARFAASVRPLMRRNGLTRSDVNKLFLLSERRGSSPLHFPLLVGAPHQHFVEHCLLIFCAPQHATKPLNILACPGCASQNDRDFGGGQVYSLVKNS